MISKIVGFIKRRWKLVAIVAAVVVVAIVLVFIRRKKVQ